MRARMALELSKTPYEHREILLRDKPDAMLKASPKGTVPVLQMTDDTVIDESLDVMHWAFEAASSSMQNVSGIEKDLINTNDNSFKEALDNYKYANRDPEKEEEVRASSILKATEFLSKLNGLVENQKFLLGNDMSFADLALFPFVRQFSKVDDNTWQNLNLKHLDRWLNHFITSQAFANIMKKYPLWSEGNEPLLINEESI